MPLNDFITFALRAQPFATFTQLSAKSALACEPKFRHPAVGNHPRSRKGKLNRALAGLRDESELVNTTTDLCHDNPPAKTVYDSRDSKHPPDEATYAELCALWANAAGVMLGEVWLRREQQDTPARLSALRQGSEPVSAELVLTGFFLGRSFAEAQTWERKPHEGVWKAGDEIFGDRYCSAAEYTTLGGQRVAVCCPWVARWRTQATAHAATKHQGRDETPRQNYDPEDRDRVVMMLRALHERSQQSGASAFLIIAPDLPPKRPDVGGWKATAQERPKAPS